MTKIPVFDIGDTLSPSKTYSRKFFKQKLKEEGIKNPPKYPFEGHNEFVEQSIQEWLDKENLDIEASKLVKAYKKDKKKRIEESGVLQELKKIEKNITTPGIVSDNKIKAKKYYQQIFNEHNVNIEGFVVSEEINVRKPDTQIFQEFLNRRKTQAENCVYYGNRGDIDSSCQKIGMNFVWVTTYDTFGTTWDGQKINKITLENIQKTLK